MNAWQNNGSGADECVVFDLDQPGHGSSRSNVYAIPAPTFVINRSTGIKYTPVSDFRTSTEYGAG
jgi:hypothetical protein